MSEWFRVEVTDQHGQVVAIESESLAGRDIGEEETETIKRAIAHLSGFIGAPDWQHKYECALEVVAYYQKEYFDQARTAR